MSGTSLNRGNAPSQVVTIAASGTTSTAYDAREGITYGVFIPTGFEGVALTFTTSHTEAGTYVTAYDSAGVALTITVSDPGYFPLPADLAACPWFKIVSGATETNERSLRIVSKS